MNVSIGETSPIFILGRQHSGSTMLSLMLDGSPAVLSMRGESGFFNRLPGLERLEFEDRVHRIVDIIKNCDVPPLPLEVCRELTSSLLDSSQAGSPDSAVSLYSRAMDYLLARRGKTRWAHKASSYVFHVESILKSFPDAKLIFLCRHPLDIFASAKRRGTWIRGFSLVWEWNNLIRLAERYQAKFPRNFFIIRYEDIINSPEFKLKQICDFTDIEFNSNLLSRLEVKGFETPYELSEGETETNKSKVFYYRDVLTPAEETIIRTVLSSPLLRRIYPEDISPAARLDVSYIPSLLKFTTLGLGGVILDKLEALVSSPAYALEWIMRRLG